MGSTYDNYESDYETRRDKEFREMMKLRKKLEKEYPELMKYIEWLETKR